MKECKKFSWIMLSVLALSFSIPNNCPSYAGEGIVYKVWSVIQAFKEKDVFDNECFAKTLLKYDRYQYDRFRVARRNLLQTKGPQMLYDPALFFEVTDQISELLKVYRDFFERFFYSSQDPCFDKIRIFMENPVLKDVEEFINETPGEFRTIPFNIPDVDFTYIPSPAESTLPLTELLRQQGVEYDKLGINLKNAVDTADEWMWSHRTQVRNGLIVAGIGAAAFYNLPAVLNLLSRSVQPGIAASIFLAIPNGDNIFCNLKKDTEDDTKKTKGMSYYDCELKAQEQASGDQR